MSFLEIYKWNWRCVPIILFRLDFKTNKITKAYSSYWFKLDEEINAVDKISATMQYGGS